ncbi:hypothetical protein TIFTF001_042078 [Ficus carica]|uniref:Protein kinase domain-containing protein n=1 Tax=Ficus carica TaxID=3494 RepID=A0AA88CTQ1_FICCA|nr:hypothetical protein TIFTF001_042078 [Ficus carica]
MASGVEFSSLLNMNYTIVLKMGFFLNWNAHSCGSCEMSGGRCGINANEFVCFCDDRPHKKTCDDGERNLKLKIGIEDTSSLLIQVSIAASYSSRLNAGVGSGLGGAIIMFVVLLLCYRKRRKREQNPPKSLLSRDISSDFSSVNDAEKGSTYFGVHLFGYEELVEATNNFDTSKELGDGGFGTVYYGKLHDGRVVAVKRLYENNFRRVEQFKNEIAILARLRHRNLVSLYGCTSRHSHELLLLTSKSDVFSFGVVMMELVSSMPAVDITRHRHDINLSTMAMNRIQNHALNEVVDPTLGFDTDSRVRKMITAVAELAFQCLQHEKDLRPSMVDVLEELKAIQSREYSMERAEKIDAAADDAVLLMSGPHPLSPDSVVFKWESSTTTPNASS